MSDTSITVIDHAMSLTVPHAGYTFIIICIHHKTMHQRQVLKSVWNTIIQAILNVQINS